ncbi:uncharacterized protein LOC116007591 [Ipomoea triloba]|uniref:uncharacterized protein LOC116007591 n=1 Tax=Ipomoea triloba TaxID=35885 RepID=UPI00125CE4A4|nr:uncharacterized protein LOC116007591 [Ipomoea triloba]
MRSSRHWMYTRIRNGLLTEEFLAGLETFIQFATSQHSWMDGERIRCPCTQRKCQNTKFLDVPTVKYHLAKYGFVSDYYIWRFHSESNVRVDVDRDVGGPSQMASEETSNAYHTMVMDANALEFNLDALEESPNPEAQKFYDMLKAVDQELWPGCKKHSQLSLIARLISLKSENHISEKCFNQITELMKEVVPENNLVPDNFYEAKRLLRAKRTSTGRLACVPKETWRIWEAYWDRLDVKAKSEQQRKNKMSEVARPRTGCSRHIRGSRSAIEHYHKLEEIQAQRDFAMQEVEGSTKPPIINMSQLKKQRISGLGTKENSCSSSATSQLNQDAMKEIVTQQLQTMLAEMQTQLQAQMEAKLQAERTQMQAQM